MTRFVAVALALIVGACSVAVAFALGAASTRIPPTVLVDTTPTTTRLIPAAGAVRVRVGGVCVETGPAEAASMKLQPDASCVASSGEAATPVEATP